MDTWIPLISAFISGICAPVFGFIGVGVGALISYLNNRQNIQAEAKQRKEDRDEQRRKEKIQIKESDVLQIRDTIITVIKKLSEYRINKLHKNHLSKLEGEEILNSNEFIEVYKRVSNKSDVLTVEIRTIIDAMDSLVISLDDEEFSLYTKFTKTVSEYLSILSEEKEQKDSQSEGKKWRDVRFNAGMLQRKLTDKLISIRDTD